MPVAYLVPAYFFWHLTIGANTIPCSLYEGSVWPRGVTVSTLDSESSDRGSNPREASFITACPERLESYFTSLFALLMP